MKKTANRLKWPIIGFFTLVLFIGYVSGLSARQPDKDDGGAKAVVEVKFGRDCERLLIRELEGAKKDIFVAVYSITRKAITSVLTDAVERGVKVRVKYDEESSEWQGMKQAIGFLRKRGVDCTAIKMGDEYEKMHHKFAVVDGERVLTGSFNYTTTAATGNYEALLLIHSPEVAEVFLQEFEAIKSSGERENDHSMIR